ncbi:class A beta-lactamase-related serine hydrolase [Sphingomonas sp. RP10(2022)]|uniref:Class A beta-lactamase-related serine hydrolase n=1 Tax=Sphingomonas liriopis TaxID=2949094 RepID=A0A9X2HVS0_9SPHN|nr:serine hydrolase [Sphingomonas liriopis]MCP3736409.1 class A beta-lactamase-related serine hydrolase [Sphingomonas liriopis]
MLFAAAKRLEAEKLIALALAVLTPLPAVAQTPPTATVAIDPAVRTQSEALIPVLAGKPGYATLFAPAFRQAVPEPQWTALAQQLRTTLGAPQRIATLVPNGRWAATLTVAYQRGTATMLVAIDPAAPHAIAGLRITGTTASDDSAAKVTADLARLPGETHLGVYALGDAAPAPILAVKDDAKAPLGSAFKLWVLAELARQVATGTHRWDEVVPVGTPSLPSGILQGWPRGTPVTVQTLATLMISISDNTATDTLIALLGRANVDAMAARYGGIGPVLTTREAFALKSDPALTAAWAKGDAAARRALLTAQADRIATATIDPMMFSSGPVANDSVEWFAAPRDMARLLGDLRDAGPVVRALLAVNHGVDPVTSARFGYVGFKGGSEPGVIALNLLAQAKDGRWYAVCASWHRRDAAVDEAAFVALVTRALGLVAG